MSISVLIPAYNASAFIAETLESALRQTLPADDILVVDDGSTDDTAAIAAGFPAPVRVISIPNSKLGAARNFGISQIQSEWIALLDADDIWRENKLERQMEELRKHPEADICYAGHQPFSTTQGVRTFHSPVLGPPCERVRQSLLRAAIFLPSSVIMRRSKLLEVGGFSPDPGVAEDWDLWLRLRRAGVQFAACPEPLLLYRVHSKSITSDKSNTWAKNAKTYREQVVPQLHVPDRWIAPARYFSGYKVEIAYSLRDKGDPRCLSVMTASILQWPFGDFTRYKVWLHMLLTRLGVLSKPVPAGSSPESR
jgi:glycosyltransferase involved in cell wall biosynthesis